MSVLIRGGRVVTAHEDRVADVFVEGERVTTLGPDLMVEADRVIEAAGKYVLPGGIDPHVHLQTATGGTVTCDDFTAGTTAAAFGGVTTAIHFCYQEDGRHLADVLADWHGQLGEHELAADIGFHLAITDFDAGGATEGMRAAVKQGVPSFKLFMAYKGSKMVDDETLFRSMRAAAEIGGLIMVHAENGDVIDLLVREALEAGRTQPRWHEATRPALTEAEATNRAIYLAQLAGSPLYVVHVSCREALEPVELARAKGWRVWAETCPQYLFIEKGMLATPDFDGAKFVFTPPPRTAEDQEALWEALAANALSAVGSDHAPFRFDTQKSLGRDDFSRIPNGAPGIEHRLHLLHHFGVAQDRISLQRMVELLSESPARLFGLYPTKGTITIGGDADLVVFDPNRPFTITAAEDHSTSDYSLYEGLEVSGAPEVVLLRGQVVVEDEEIASRPGRFVPREPFEVAPDTLADATT